MNDYEKKIKLKFRLIAYWYDIFEIFLLSKKNNPRIALAEKIPDMPVKILDVCIGTANTSIKIARKNKKNLITGIDLSPDMIAVANKKIRKMNIDNINIRQMNAVNMDFKNNAFDIVMITFGLHEMDFMLMNNVLKEMHRVLKKRGILYIVDFTKEKNLINKMIMNIYLKIFEPGHMKSFINYDWKSLLKNIGLNVTGIEKYRFSQMITAIK